MGGFAVVCRMFDHIFARLTMILYLSRGGSNFIIVRWKRRIKNNISEESLYRATYLD